MTEEALKASQRRALKASQRERSKHDDGSGIFNF
jgi:hypothetical protein